MIFMNLHPKFVSGLFAIIYYSLGGIIQITFKIQLYNHVLFYIIGLVIDIIVYEIALRKYNGNE